MRHRRSGSQARDELAGAEVYWLSTVRPDGRPHVTPLLGVWLEGALYFCTGPNERKAKNLSANRHCVLTTGHSTLDGLDLVIEGTGEGVSDHAELERVANTYESKYGPHFVAPDGTWSGLGDAIRRAEVLVYRVAPETGLGLAKEAGSAKHAGAFDFDLPRSPGRCNTSARVEQGVSGEEHRSGVSPRNGEVS